MNPLRVSLFMALLGVAGSLPGAAEAPRQVVPLREHERVVHLVSSVFAHAYYEPKLEVLLLQAGAGRDLVFRQVHSGQLSDLLKELDARVLVHKPTLVIYQAGSDDLFCQSRRQGLDFGAFPQRLDELAQRLTGAGARLVLCSVPPVGNGSSIRCLVPPNDGLKTWVDAAHQVALRHKAAFADLFTDALEWPMIGNSPQSRFYYSPEGYDRSLRLMLNQVEFGEGRGDKDPPSLPSVGEELKAELARGHDLAATLSRIQAFTLPPWVRMADYEMQRAAAVSLCHQV